MKKNLNAHDTTNLENHLDITALDTKLVAVYCGAKSGHNPIYMERSFALGKALAKNNFGLVYGGAKIGLMGKVADGVIAEQGMTVGVIPEFLLDYECAHEHLAVFHTTDTMHTRKAVMAEYANAFISLPGGFGTLEEMTEIATWRQLDRHTKPMILLNINGYYDYFVKHLEHSVNEGLVKQQDIDYLHVCNTVEEAIELLTKYVTD